MTYQTPINRTPNKQFCIGIDPDTAKNGVALYCRKTRKIQELKLLDFDSTLAYVSVFAIEDVTVYVDAGWRNKNPQFHKVKIPERLKEHPEAAARYLAGVSNKIAHSVGRNAETGKLLCKQLTNAGYEVIEVQPKNRKWTPDEMLLFTGIATKNQEKIDSVRLVWGR